MPKLNGIIFKIKSHWPALALALTVGALAVWPTVYSIYQIGPAEFAGIYPRFNNDEYHYQAQTREVLDGHAGLGNTFVAEHKDAPYLQPPLAQIIMAAEARLLDWSVPAAFALNDFILPLIAVLLLYGLIFRLTGRQGLALIFSAFYFLLFLRDFGRPVNPQFSFIFLAAALLVIWQIFNQALAGRRLLAYQALLALLFAILLYVYPYYWTTVIVLYFLALVLSAVRSKNYLNNLSAGLLFLVLAAVLALPYLLNLKQAIASPAYGESLLRLGLIKTHWPGCFVNVGLLAASLLLVWLWRQKFRSRSRLDFVYLLALGGIIVNWQNVITGSYIQFSSHYYPVTVLLLVLVWAIIFNQLINSRELKIIYRFSLAGLFLITSLFLYNRSSGLSRSISVSQQKVDLTREQQRLARLADWFNSNTAAEPTVYSLSADGWMLPIYTRANTFNSVYYLMSDQEVEERWAIANFWRQGVDADFIISQQRNIWGNRFIDSYQNRQVRQKIFSLLTGRKPDPGPIVPPEYIDRVLQKYNQLKKVSFEELTGNYQMDYILLDTNDNEHKHLVSLFDGLARLKLVAKIDNNYIYQVN